MGSGADFIVLAFLVLYLGPAWLLCAKVAKKTQYLYRNGKAIDLDGAYTGWSAFPYPVRHRA